MTEPTNELLTDFWSQIPGGKEKPEYFNQRLVWKGIKDWPEGLKAQIEERHGKWQWGYNWDCVDLPDTEYVAVMVRRIPASSTSVTHFPGLNNDENTFYAWQKGMVEVDGIYFFNKSAGTLQSINDLTSEISQQPVCIYIYGGDTTEKSPMILRPDDKNGRPYYAVMVHSIRRIEDILNLFHELGHVIVDSRNRDKFVQEREAIKPIYKRDAEARNRRAEDLDVESTLDERWLEIIKEFYRSEGYQKKVDVEMREEVDAWSGALYLLSRVGIIEAFDKGDNQLLDYMLYCIKTRISPGI